MTTQKTNLKPFLRFLSAYAWLIFFAALGLGISWCLRSDIILLSMALSAPGPIINFLYTWTTPLVIIPWVLACVFLEHYMNEGAQTSTVRRRALKVLAIEGGIGLVAMVVVGLLALAGLPPVW